MGTIYRRANPTLARISTTKLLSITTAETLLTLGSASTAFEINNLSSATIYYGNSGVLTNSGGLIVEDGAKFWDHVQSGFQMYLVVISGGITGRALVHEYEGE